MKKIIAFTGSTSHNSINRKLLKYIIREFPNDRIEFLDLKEYDIPIYSTEIEKKGIPIWTKELFQTFTSVDGFILASPEHNGLPSAFLKNHIDWLSRVDQRFLQDKPILLLSTSPGATGGKSHLEILAKLVQRWGGELVGQFSLGDFNRNFDCLTNTLCKSKDEQSLKQLVESLLNYQKQPTESYRSQREMELFLSKIVGQYKNKGYL
ncbi:MAG: NAD(P)H-dependent oxidoreductase [Bacteroidota bacterium]|nr:NAD(P)H-dependent oxidoreductase [Bacteroidota bacterium]